ncbi:hypothetical protein N7539_000939 [Penicillium diatomitis]|uniref:Uncharacterized protein n=1 Tax=Penicillium diatomitis TaxID=2819901 RepID=A0A9W9XMT2_9EURO|nr:uncharacterized protein N7539_000939 [Penicillium diatomitis]KAJ5495823.1 hypothetical protein N7539_000939 [Penicillium diatomitis]
MARTLAPLASRLPLSKFSFTTTTINSHSRMIWTHINGDGTLFCETESRTRSSTHAQSFHLKVVQNNSVLEEIDLTAHLENLRNEPSSSQTSSRQKPSFVVVVKLPCLAIKFPLDDTHIRRFQIKFSQDHDYYTMLSMLSGMNCPLTEGTWPAAGRHPSSTSAGTAQTTLNLRQDMGNAITPESIRAGSCGGMTNAQCRHDIGVSLDGSASDKGCSYLSPVPRAPSLPSAQVPSAICRGVISLTEPHDIPANEEGMADSKPQLPRAQEALNHSPEPSSQPTSGPVSRHEDINQMLPPKRALPFPRNRSKVSRADTASLKSSQQIVPESSYPDQSTNRRHESLASDLQSQLIQPHKSPQPDVTDQYDAFRSNSQSQLFQTQALPDTLEPSRQSTQLPPTLPLPRLDRQVQAEIFTPFVQQSQVDTPMPPEANAPQIQGRPAAVRLVHTPVEGQLAEYAKASTTERTAFLENWMCELIEDDNFVTLCEDVENTWRRFAFGAKS